MESRAETAIREWQQDPYGNFLARCIVPEQARELTVEVDLIAEMTATNPFDCFVEPHSDEWPFEYEPWLARDLRPFLECAPLDGLQVSGGGFRRPTPAQLYRTRRLDGCQSI